VAQQQLLLPAQLTRKVHIEPHMQCAAPASSIAEHRHALIRQNQLAARRYNVISDRQLQQLPAQRPQRDWSAC
jgi:hypothetical protein